MHFVIIIVSYLALIRLRFVELGFRQIKIKYIQYNTIEYSASRNIAESNNTRVYASIKATNIKEGHIKSNKFR